MFDVILVCVCFEVSHLSSPSDKLSGSTYQHQTVQVMLRFLCRAKHVYTATCHYVKVIIRMTLHSWRADMAVNIHFNCRIN